eukprot:7426313-Prorocentrum_lima.AAC.1
MCIRDRTSRDKGTQVPTEAGQGRGGGDEAQERLRSITPMRTQARSCLLYTSPSPRDSTSS